MQKRKLKSKYMQLNSSKVGFYDFSNLKYVLDDLWCRVEGIEQNICDECEDGCYFCGNYNNYN